MSEKIVTACLVIIGNEILSGRTQDANLAYLAKGLNSVGVQMREVRVIPDVCDTIVATINEVRAKFDYVFTTGGIGPTHDDITGEAIAKAFGVKHLLNSEAYKILAAHYTNPADFNPARQRMAHIPEGASLVYNPVSLAPGFQLGNVFVLAGVPRIMQAMFDGIKDRLSGALPVLQRSVFCSLPEGIIAKGLEEIQFAHPNLDIGSYPTYGGPGPRVGLVVRGTSEAEVGRAIEAVAELVRSLGGEPMLE